MSEWISVKDLKPPEEENVILYDGKVVFCGNLYICRENEDCYGNQACDGCCYGWYEKKPITHWMPLPKAPEVKSEALKNIK